MNKQGKHSSLFNSNTIAGSSYAETSRKHFSAIPQ